MDWLTQGYVQGGALLVLILGGATAIVALWGALKQQAKETREDRKEYLEAVRASTKAIEGLHAELRFVTALMQRRTATAKRKAVMEEG